MTVYVTETWETAGNWERAFIKEMRGMGSRALHKAGPALIHAARDEVASSNVNWRYRYAKSWKKRASRNKLLIYSGSHRAGYNYGLVVEGGRRPGAVPPSPLAILPWVVSKLGGDYGTAVAVARKIGQSGIKARPTYTSKAAQQRFTRIVLYSCARQWDLSAARAKAASYG